MWPAPGMICSRAPGMPAASASAYDERRLLVELPDEHERRQPSISPSRPRTSCEGRQSTAARSPSAEMRSIGRDGGGHRALVGVRGHDRAQHGLGDVGRRLARVERGEPRGAPGLGIVPSSPNAGLESSSVSERKRPGGASAACCAIMPPNESPTRCACVCSERVDQPGDGVGQERRTRVPPAGGGAAP